MTILTVPARLVVFQKAILQSLGYGQVAYSEAPASLTATPAFINMARPATDNYDAQGDGWDIETRDYLMRLFARPAATGIVGEGEREIRALISAVKAYFRKRPALNDHTILVGGAPLPDMDGVRKAYIIGDTGPARMIFEEGGSLYVGVEFTLRVEEQVQFTYIPGN